jgi:hypothetical protein
MFSRLPPGCALSSHEVKLFDSQRDERNGEPQENAVRGGHEGLLVRQQGEGGAHESHRDGHLLTLPHRHRQIPRWLRSNKADNTDRRGNASGAGWSNTTHRSRGAELRGQVWNGAAKAAEECRAAKLRTCSTT